MSVQPNLQNAEARVRAIVAQARPALHGVTREACVALAAAASVIAANVLSTAAGVAGVGAERAQEVPFIVSPSPMSGKRRLEPTVPRLVFYRDHKNSLPSSLPLPLPLPRSMASVENETKHDLEARANAIPRYDEDVLCEQRRLVRARLVDAAVNKVLLAPMLRAEAWYVLCVKGDGGCLFTSLRLAYELFMTLRRALKRARIGSSIVADDLEPLSQPMLDGHSAIATQQGVKLRAAVVQWFREGLETPLPGNVMIRDKDEGDSVRRRVTRGDLLMNMLIVDHGREVPETLKAQVDALEAAAAALEANGDEDEKDAHCARQTADRARAQWTARQHQLHAYLDSIAHPAAWASFAEMQAWAYMSRLAHVVYYPSADGCSLLPPQLAAVPPEGLVSGLKLRARVPDDVAAAHSDTRDLREFAGPSTPQPSFSLIASPASSVLSGASSVAAVPSHTPQAPQTPQTPPPFDLPSLSLSPTIAATATATATTAVSTLSTQWEPEDALPHEDDLAFAGRLLHSGRHYSVLVSASQAALLTHAFPLLVSLFVPLSKYVRTNML